ncbi:hypothetical protein SAMN05421882_10184 [Nitrosomonas communis]|uniref:Uncharacterized protein n=1 Tax=Nitrosomonas communis TaxID=44574 RepID=A0A1H2UUE8_9PROT|nr:hypothetical protein SAMN05421882_10184 [Nitrosomonas communis]
MNLLSYCVIYPVRNKYVPSRSNNFVASLLTVHLEPMHFLALVKAKKTLKLLYPNRALTLWVDRKLILIAQLFV